MLLRGVGLLETCVTQNTSRCDTRHNEGGCVWLEWCHQSRGDPENTGEAKVTKRTNKTANIEGKFFGMIVLAWVVLAVVFNLAHSFIPQAKAPAAAKTTTTAATRTVQVASLR